MTKKVCSRNKRSLNCTYQKILRIVVLHLVKRIPTGAEGISSHWRCIARYITRLVSKNKSSVWFREVRLPDIVARIARTTGVAISENIRRADSTCSRKLAQSRLRSALRRDWFVAEKTSRGNRLCSLVLVTIEWSWRRGDLRSVAAKSVRKNNFKIWNLSRDIIPLVELFSSEAKLEALFWKAKFIHWSRT